MIDAIIRRAREMGVTDIHITPNESVRFRRLGRLERTEYGSDEKTWSDWWQNLLSPYEEKILRTFGAVEVAPDNGMRVSLFRTSGMVVGSIRLLQPLAMLPPDPNLQILKKAAQLKSGLLLIGGITGSGKTTTMWRILQMINDTCPVHVIALEDPPEYRLESNVACIRQRGIGTDVPDWETGLVSALREDPDVLVIGELRTSETVASALRAAQTGHLVLATLHCGSAESMIGRLVHMFPTGGQEEIRYQLAATLQLLLVQCLVPLCSQQVVLREWAWRNPALVTLIRDGKEHQLSAYLQTMGRYAQTWEQSRRQVLQMLVPGSDDATLLHAWQL